MPKRSTVICLVVLIFWVGVTAQSSRLYAQSRHIAVQEARQRMDASAGGAVEITHSTALTGGGTVYPSINPDGTRIVVESHSDLIPGSSNLAQERGNV